MTARPDRCRVCGEQLPPPAPVGRPRLTCSTECRKQLLAAPPDQAPLPGLPSPPVTPAVAQSDPAPVVDDEPWAPGAVELATIRSVEAAQLDERDLGLAAALVAHARSLDKHAAVKKATYGTTHGLPPFVEAARALGLSPDADSRKDTGGDDTFSQLMRQLSEPTLGDPAQP